MANIVADEIIRASFDSEVNELFVIWISQHGHPAFGKLSPVGQRTKRVEQFVYLLRRKVKHCGFAFARYDESTRASESQLGRA